MTPKAAQYVSSPGSGEIVVDFVESEVHDVVVMNLLGRELVADIQPNAMQEIDFLRREVRHMWTEVEDALLAGWEVNAERQEGSRFSEAFPCVTRQTRFFVEG